MADYSIISDLSGFMIQQFREKMCPSPIPAPGNIELSSPSNQNADYILGLYLYNIQEEGEIAAPLMRRSGQMRMKKVPKPYTLYYMLFINGFSQMGLKATDAQKIIGRAAQITNDITVILPSELQDWLETEEPPILLSPARIDLEEKVRIWQAIDKPYQLSLFYKAAPIFLSSEIIVDIPRVKEASFILQDAGRQGG